MNCTPEERRKKYDQYFTPHWVTNLFLDNAPDDLVPGMSVWEPCAGHGHIDYPLRERGFEVVATDIDSTIMAPNVVTGVNFMKVAPPGALEDQPDWIITNPPYRTADVHCSEVIRHALDHAPRVAMLLRLSWLEHCPDRRDLHECIDEIMTVYPRVNFINAKDNNNAPSIWCIWRREPKYTPGQPKQSYLVVED